MVIAIKNIINSSNAVHQADGLLLFAQLEKTNLKDIAFDFSGIKFLSSAFLNASIGKLALLYPDIIRNLNYLIPQDKQIFREKINQVIDNALLGENFDNIVREA